jgi:hypothetical protein
VPKKIGFSNDLKNFPGSEITAEEWEFMQAIQAYQTRTGRRFPTWREIFAIARDLGYRKVATPEADSRSGDDERGKPCH